MAPSQLNWGQALSAGPEMPRSRFEWGLHTGEPTLGEEGYLGLDVVRGARIASAAHGGQVLVSETTRALLPADLPGGAEIIDLGQHSLKTWSGPSTCSKWLRRGFAQIFRRRAPTQPVGTRKTSSDGSMSLSTAASRPCSRGSTSRKWSRDAGC